MSSARRIQVAATPAIERALAVAARRWPAASRSELVRRLIVRGAGTIECGERTASRLGALRATAGVLTGAYRARESEELRTEWPE